MESSVYHWMYTDFHLGDNIYLLASDFKYDKKNLNICNAIHQKWGGQSNEKRLLTLRIVK